MIAFAGAIGDVLTSSTMYGSTVRFAALLVFAATGEWVAEKAGTMNISVEAMILTGSFTAAIGSYLGHSVWIGLVFGMLGGLLVSLIQANMSHRLGSNQFVVGLTLNVLAVGLTAYLNAKINPTVTKAGAIKIPLLSRIPLVGGALFGQTWLLYLLFPLIPFAWWLVYRTRWGLEVRSVGESPQAVDVSGIDVNKRRRQSVYFCGLCSGVAGAYLTIGQVGSFGTDGVSGRGIIALAAVILGGWTLKGTVGAAVVFGFFDALRFALPALGHTVNPQLLATLPYAMALTTMLLFAHRGRQPSALTRPFVRGLT